MNGTLIPSILFVERLLKWPMSSEFIHQLMAWYQYVLLFYYRGPPGFSQLWRGIGERNRFMD